MVRILKTLNSVYYLQKYSLYSTSFLIYQVNCVFGLLMEYVEVKYYKNIQEVGRVD